VSFLHSASRSGVTYTCNTATHLTNFIFDGARADLMKGLSMDPAFQVTHSFQLASQSSPPTYSFGALFANAKVGYDMPTFRRVIIFFMLIFLRKVLLQGNVDHEGNVSGRFQQSWLPSHTSKVQAQVCMMLFALPPTANSRCSNLARDATWPHHDTIRA
jgi:hypothetical protein